MKRIIVLVTALAACGGKGKKAAAPDTTMDKGSASSTGGATYGGETKPTGSGS